MSVRDSQRSKVYAWEKNVLYPMLGGGGEQMSLYECRRLVHKVLDDFGIESPAVVSGAAHRRRGSANLKEIKLPGYARNVGYVLHEVAHVIMLDGIFSHRNYGLCSSHGMQFMSVYHYLLSNYTRLESVDILLSIRKAGIALDHWFVFNRVLTPDIIEKRLAQTNWVGKPVYTYGGEKYG